LRPTELKAVTTGGTASAAGLATRPSLVGTPSMKSTVT
jgi:hypothetical protein